MPVMMIHTFQGTKVIYLVLSPQRENEQKKTSCFPLSGKIADISPDLLFKYFLKLFHKGKHTVFINKIEFSIQIPIYYLSIICVSLVFLKARKQVSRNHHVLIEVVKDFTSALSLAPLCSLCLTTDLCSKRRGFQPFYPLSHQTKDPPDKATFFLGVCDEQRDAGQLTQKGILSDSPERQTAIGKQKPEEQSRALMPERVAGATSTSSKQLRAGFQWRQHHLQPRGSGVDDYSRSDFQSWMLGGGGGKHYGLANTLQTLV